MLEIQALEKLVFSEDGVIIYGDVLVEASVIQEASIEAGNPQHNNELVEE